MWNTKVVVLHLNIGNKQKLFICLFNVPFSELKRMNIFSFLD